MLTALEWYLSWRDLHPSLSGAIEGCCAGLAAGAPSLLFVLWKIRSDNRRQR
ncbi:MAG: hypothetical protein ACTHK2_03875 [Dokdonella sp.]|uniref:hypothetical protein n=1 Tax=Dokdonella sp. TaxID=2291710 RepID=UPI003F806C32